jgi:hypothetical protein
MREINKAGVANWLRDKRIVKVSSSDNLTSTEEKELAKEVQSIRRRGNGICLLLVETK